MNEHNNPRQPIDKEKQQYFYYKDHEGRVKRIRKLKYETRPGYIRFKFMEKFYLKFIRSSYDSKLTWMPWVAGFSIAYFIYTVAMLWSQNDLNRQIKARLPFEFKNQQVNQVYRLLKQNKESSHKPKQPL